MTTDATTEDETMSGGNDEMTMMMTGDEGVDAYGTRRYFLEAIPEGSQRHLHKCPVEACGHELVMTRSEDGGRDRGSRSYRWALDRNGNPVQELLRVRMPNSCWCGAPLPGAEQVSFDLLDVEGNRMIAVSADAAEDDPYCKLEHVAIPGEVMP